jgi:arginine decarboxylase-like protein
MGRFNTDWKDAVGLSIHSARLRREAWESAVASQAATWMPREDLERYSNVYAGMRDVTAISLGGGVQFLDGARFRDIMSNLQMGEASPRDMYRILNQMISAYDSIDGNLLGLRKDLIAVGQASGH